MNAEVSRFLSFLAAAAALGLVLAVFGSRFLGSAAGADGAIITHLKKLERDGAEHELAWAKLVGPKLQFERISVVLDADGKGATVTSTLDFTGELRRPSQRNTRVSSLGLERARYRLVDGEWEAERTDFRFQGNSPDRPVDEKATRRLSLQEDSSTGLFSFPDGIM